ncbi:xaa-Pro aminopeptidase 3 [Microplitis demolitor]|uniref:xaa-Pro aminopeptidase 3 n=1 Tax=Microplitis demolitor TaxID=69319 RepID=UPI00044000D7|nr:xaa-Pro aminopeptidase 3 [Microplitis demolitor]
MFKFLKQCQKFRLENLGIQQLVDNYSTTISSNPITRKSSCDYHHTQTYGQPTPQTHPHLIKPGELVPGIKLEEFKTRRTKLAEYIFKNYTSKDLNSHIVIIPSASKVYMSDKIPYVFRQNTDFLYFTGCQEPDSVLVMTIDNEKVTCTLFVQKKDPKSELWDGPRTGTEAAAEMFGIDQSLPVSDFESYLNSLINKYKSSASVWYDNNDIINNEFHKKISQLGITSGTTRCRLSTTSIKNVFHQIRMIKSSGEIELMQKSCDIASEAIVKTIKISRPGMTEHQLFATVDYESRMSGAEFLAYPPVVAGGKNANIIHYITNNQVLFDGDMVLMDAGCEYHGYSSDITRTWPVNGTFNPQQKILYEVVLEVQKSLINKLKELPTLDELFYDMCDLLGKRLQEIGLIPKNISDDKLVSAAFTYCPHHVSHYLGMDVHDTGKISRSVKTQPGMIVTVEPGIYVSPKNEFAPPEFHNLGIRIEDDVLIKDGEPLVLTRNCPKEIVDIEKLSKCNQL